MTMQEWFRQAKLGIFLHWGMYAVAGVTESWSMYHGTLSREEYLAQREGFTASRFDAREWARLFQDAHAQYAVLTTKHHDGLALWDTAEGMSTVRDTPAGRDLVTEYVTAVREAGLRVGLYFSHLDWSHPDYASIRPTGMDPAERGNPFAVPAAGEEDPAAWERFLTFHRRQLTELVERFSPDLLWFDGDWERTPEQWRMAEIAAWLKEAAPTTVLNGRMTGGYGDYATPEQGVPVVPPAGPWELCLTANDSWGYQPGDTHYKSLRQLVRVFTETISGGGALLLGVGPREDGTVPEPAAERLRGLGAWIGRHERAVLSSVRGLPHGHVAAPTTLSPDRRHLYIFLADLPRDEVVLRGASCPITEVRVVGPETTIPHDRIGGMGELGGWDHLLLDGVRDAELMDPLCTVLDVEFAEPLQVRREHTRD